MSNSKRQPGSVRSGDYIIDGLCVHVDHNGYVESIRGFHGQIKHNPNWQHMCKQVNFWHGDFTSQRACLASLIAACPHPSKVVKG